MPQLLTQIHDAWAACRLEDYASFDAFADELEELRALPSIHAVFITGQAFNAADELPSPAALRALERYELPTVFAFDGQLEGAALQVALACDIRICGPNAALRLPLGTRRVLALIGAEASANLLSVRGRLDATSALAAGVVSEVLGSEEETLQRGRELTTTIASRGPIAVKLGKEAIWRGLELPFEHALRFETDLTLLLQTTKDRAEGVNAFLEKRQPHFTGE